MKRIIIALAAVATLASCSFISVNGKSLKFVKASSNYVTKEYQVADFNKFTCNIPADIEYSDGNAALSITAPDNILDIIEADVNDGALKISFNAKVINLRGVKIRVSARELNALTINGAGDFDAGSGIVTGDFNATVNGACDMDINGLKAKNVTFGINGAGDLDVRNLDCGSVSVCINGAGDCNLSGTAGTAGLTINGAGSIDVTNLKSDSVSTTLHGAGSIRR